MGVHTPEEQEISDLIVEAHNKFAALLPTHPDELRTWVDNIHSLQSLLGMRALRRLYPEDYVTIKDQLQRLDKEFTICSKSSYLAKNGDVKPALFVTIGGEKIHYAPNNDLFEH